MSKKVYIVGHEMNDKGWKMGYQAFKLPNDAVQLMRDCVAKYIRERRSDGQKVKNLHVWSDRVMLDSAEKSQTITFTVDNYFHDFRVFAITLHDEKIQPKDVKGY